MRPTKKTAVWILGSVFVCVAASGITPGSSSDPYGAISRRNVFGLKEAPPPEVNPPAPPPKIYLTGITTILGDKRALMKMLLSSRPGQQPKEESFVLAEGQREGEVEVVRIDEKAGKVEVENSGIIMTLTFDKDGVKAAPVPMPAALPGPGYQPGMQTAPAATPAFGQPGQRVLPARTLATPNNASVSPVTAPGTMSPPATGVGSLQPTGTANGVLPPLPSVSQQNPLSAEEQLILSELDRAQRTNVNTTAPPMNSGATITAPGVVVPPGQGQVPGQYGLPFSQ